MDPAKETKVTQKKQKKEKPSSKKQEIIDDDRFKSIYSDPRFKQIKASKTKVTVDKRFEKVFDKEFTGEQTKGVDYKGRKISKKKGKSEMSRYYKLQQEEEIDEKLDRLNKLARGELSSDEYDESESSSSEESDVDEEEIDEIALEDDLVDPELKALEEQDQNVEMGEETNRLACVNLDWSKIKAVDLYSVFNSFVGDGNLLSVTIYKSAFGKQRMENEEKYGPEGHQVYENISDEDDEDLIQDNEEIMDIRLRQYERSRLKYFFCIIECDTVFTANNIYNNCDGTEYQVSGNIFDLRYVPEGTVFNKEDIVDKCTYMPLDYAPHYNMKTSVLSKTNVELSWDQEDESRNELLRWNALNPSKNTKSKKKGNKNDLDFDSVDIDQYIASDEENGSSDNENDTAKLREKYIKLLKERSGDFSEEKSQPTNENDEEGDKEVSFVPGLEKQFRDKLKQKEEEQAETSNAYEEYKKIMKEKRKNRRNANEKETTATEKDDFFDTNDDINDDFFLTSKTSNKPEKKKGKKGKKEESEEDKKKRAQLELMLMNEDSDNNLLEDDDEDDKYMNKRKKKHDNDDFEIDLNDSRFSSLYTDKDYHIDPTSKDFNKTNNMNKLIMDISKKRKKN